MIPVGAAVETLDITRPVPMSGFAAKTEASRGTHDPITVRAVAVASTCVVVVDVVGLDAECCAEIRQRSPFADDAITVSATHTHSGPAVMRGALGPHDDQVRQEIIEAAVRATKRAQAAQAPSTLYHVDVGAQPVATDRRKGGRPDAAHLKAVRWTTADSGTAGWLVVYPCHPTVLGADNHLLSADYPGYLRRRLENLAPGSIAIFATGCAGDLNCGHKVSASYSNEAAPGRTFEEAERIGSLLGDALSDARWRDVTGDGVATAVALPLTLRCEPLDTQSPQELAAQWAAQQASSSVGEGALLQSWIDWSDSPKAGQPAEWSGRVTAMRWGNLALAFLPGEPFLGAALSIESCSAHEATMVLGYTDGCPGYLPMAQDYADGGYEVNDAHRYYGMPAPFERGSAERAVKTVAQCLDAVSAR
jgi:neutral ceramidase